MDPKSESENESPTPPSSGSNNNNNSSSSSSSPPPPASPPPSPPSDSKNNNSSSSASSPPPPASPPPSPPASPPPSPPQSPPQSPPPSQGSPPPPNQDSSSSPPPPPTKSDTPSPPNSQSPPPPSPPPPPSNTPSPPAPAGSIPPPTNRPTAGSAFSPPPPVSVTPASSSKSPPPSRSTPPANKSPGSSSAGDPAPSSDSSISSVGIIAGIAVAGIVVLAFIILCLACSRRRKKRQYYFDPSHHHKDQYYNGSVHSPRPIDHMSKLPPPPGGAGGWAAPPPPPTGIISSDYSSGYSGQHNTHLPPPSPKMGNLGGLNQSQFTYEELATATSGFSQANLLGQGGFGYVHKGFLPDGRTIAVKSLKSGSGQGEREFQAEVEIISRVHHRHLVSLVGYCITESQRMLVYEFVANKTLEFHLHGTGKAPMDWSSRLRIAVGSAKGLAYLHEDCHPRIIHRDIKTANILLDNNYEAMVADFGLAKLTSDNDTHVSTRVMGTFGYLAPEYAQSGKLTEKSDVFSFGVMLLELITGRKPVDSTNKVMEDSLVDWARPLLTKALEDGNYDQLADPRLEGNYIPHEMARMVASAAASIRHSARRRPKMSQIVRALQGDSALEDLNDGVKPGQSSAYGTTGGTVGYDTGAYNADMMKFRKMIMPSQEMTSGEYGATSEYGLNPSSSSSDSRGNSGPQRLKR